MNESHSSSKVDMLLQFEAICDEFEELLQRDASVSVDRFVIDLPPNLREELRPHLERIWQSKFGDDATCMPDRTSTARMSATRPAEANPQDSGAHWVGQVIAERYQLVSFVGRGGTATVWQAVDRVTGKPVAIKLAYSYSECIATRFEREFKVTHSLRHPGIPEAFAFGDHLGFPFLVSEFIDGCSLAEHIARQTLTVRESVLCVRKVCRVVEFAHAHGVVHRDLKPQNVLLDKDLRVYVTDFGLAQIDSTDQVTLTRTGDVVGTLAYMAPEQARGDGKHSDQRTDVYGLGMLLYHLLAGEVPFRGSPQHVLFQVLHTDLPHVRLLAPHVPKPLDWLVQKCIEKLPQHRFASVAEICRQLDLYLENKPMSVPRPTWLFQWQKWSARNRRLAGALATVAVLLLTTTLVSVSAAILLRNAFFEELESRQLAEVASRRAESALAAAKTSQLQAAAANRTALSAAQQAQQEALQSQYVEQILVSLFEANDPVSIAEKTGELPNERVDDLHAVLRRGIEKISGLNSMEVTSKSRLLDVLANISRVLRKFDQAQALLDEAALLRETDSAQFVGARHQAYALRGQLFQANLFRDQGLLPEAEQLYQTAQAGIRKLGPDYEWLLADTLLAHGDMKLQDHQTAAGQAKLRESLYLREKLYGASDLASLFARIMLASSHGKLSEFEFPKDKKFTWASEMYNCYVSAQEHADQKQFPQAIDAYRKFLTELRDLLGSDSRWLCLANGEFAGFLFDAGEYREAYAVIRGLLDELQDVIPQNHHVRKAQLTLANELLRGERPDQAYSYFQRLEATTQTASEVSEDVLLGLIWSSIGTGRTDNLLSYAEQLISRRRSVTAVQSAWYSYTHARALEHVGLVEDARQFDLEALHDAELVEPTASESPAWLERLAAIYTHAGQPSRAIEILRLAVEKETQKRFAEHPRVAQYQAALAENLQHTGVLSEARELWRQVRRTWLASLPDDDPRLAISSKAIEQLNALMASHDSQP